MKLFGFMARYKKLRGTALDIFGYSAERKRERMMIERYEQDIRGLLGALSEQNHATAVELAQLPHDIRGFGHVKEQSMDEADQRRNALLAEFANPGPASAAA